MLTGRPLYLPAAAALAIPSSCRSSMISRSDIATPAKIVSVSLLVGLRVSNRSPPISPQSGMVIAPWQRGELPPDDEPRLWAVLDQFAAFNGWCRALRG
jgi:hypothetical protein